MIKKILLTLAMVLFTSSCFAAVDDGISVTCTRANRSDIRTCTVAWANDTGTDIGPVGLNIPAGYIRQMAFVPDTTSTPTAAYDAFLYESNSSTTGFDLLFGAGADLSATVTHVAIPDLGDSHGQVWQNGTVYPHVSGLTNSNDDEGTIILHIYIGK